MFAVDDELETSTKFEALDSLPAARRARAFEAWVRLGAACRKRGNGGMVTLALANKILHAWRPGERVETLCDLVAARGGRPQGLLAVAPDGWRFHAWEEWQPDEDEAAEERETVSKKTLRQRRWRHSRRVGVDASASTARLHEASTVDDDAATTEAPTERLPEVSRARRAPAPHARSPIPSLPDPVTRGDLSSASSSDQVAGEPSIALTSTRKAEALRSAAAAAFTQRGIAAPRDVNNLDGPVWHELARRLDEPALAAHGAALDVFTKMLAALIDDPRAKAAGYPIGWLSARPAQYLSARVEPQADLVRLAAGIPRASASGSDDDEMTLPPRRKRA